MNEKPNQQAIHRPSAASAWMSVVRTYQCCTRQYELMLGELGLTIAQFDILVSIQRLGDEALPKNIAETLLVTRSNITPILQRLQERGLVELHRHPEDGRARIARLTALGQQELSRAMPAARRFVEEQMAAFSADDIRTTQSLMDRMYRHLLSLDPAAISHPGNHES